MLYSQDTTQFGDHEWLFDRKDALLHVRDRTLITMTTNIRDAINPHAVYSPGLAMSLDDNGGAVIDSFFGYGYTGLPVKGSAVYGPTETLLPSALDDLADLGYLRVPFKRIPRISASGVDDVVEIVRMAGHKYGADNLLFRGQTTEYYLHRSPAFCDLFYGDSNVLEPSLLPSAMRRKPSIETCMPEFMMWVQLWQETSLNLLGNRLDGLRAAVFEQMAAPVRNNWSEPRFYFQALALAQHYGLPSVGLDVSSDLNVALFFALREAVKSGKQKMHYRSVPSTCRPVIYILVREGTREYAFHDSVPFILQFGRPANQKAWFMHLGFGLASNAVADQIVAAIYLGASSSHDSIPEANELFPSPELDRLGTFLSSIGDLASEPLRAVLSDLYWVEDNY